MRAPTIECCRRHLSDPAWLLSAAVLLMLGAGFFTPTGSAWSDLFYIICGPAMLVALWRGKYALEDGRESANYLPLALILWSIATVFWCTDPGRRNDQYLIEGFCILLFFMALLTALREPAFFRSLGDVLIWCGALSALAALLTYPWRNGIGGRLSGFGETRQAILGASVIAVPALIALARLLAGEILPTWRRWAYAGAAALLLLFVGLTQSRGPLAGLAAGILVLLLSARRWRTLALVIFGPGLLLGLDRGLRESVIGVLTQRGTSFRLEIWRASLSRIAEHPWIGHGMGARLGFENFTFPHDLFLSLLFYSGTVGLLLFLALTGRLLYGLMRRSGPERSLLIALWANMLVSGLTDYGQIIKGPSPLWYIVWVPIACSAVYVTRARMSVAGEAA